MSTIPEIKARLLGPGTPFRAVLGATALATVKDRPIPQLPMAYVLVSREASAPNDRTVGKSLQLTERDVMVVIVCEDLGDVDGDAVADQVEELKSYVRGRLIGFVPSDMRTRITHVGGEVVEAVLGCVWFEDTFSAPVYTEEL